MGFWEGFNDKFNEDMFPRKMAEIRAQKRRLLEQQNNEEKARAYAQTILKKYGHLAQPMNPGVTVPNQTTKFGNMNLSVGGVDVPRKEGFTPAQKATGLYVTATPEEISALERDRIRYEAMVESPYLPAMDALFKSDNNYNNHSMDNRTSLHENENLVRQQNINNLRNNRTRLQQKREEIQSQKDILNHKLQYGSAHPNPTTIEKKVAYIRKEVNEGRITKEDGENYIKKVLGGNPGVVVNLEKNNEPKLEIDKAIEGGISNYITGSIGYRKTKEGWKDEVSEPLFIARQQIKLLEKHPELTGIFSGPLTDLKNTLNSFGLNYNTAQIEQFKANSAKEIMAWVQQTKGAISDKEMAQFKDWAPNASKTPEANLYMYNIKKQILERQLALRNIVQKMRKNKKSIVEIDNAVRSYQDQNPIRLPNSKGEVPNFKKKRQLDQVKAGKYQNIGGVPINDPVKTMHWLDLEE